MELLEGEDLSQRLSRERLSIAETISVITQVCKALERAHAEGIVHRDIKPANVFLVSGPETPPLVKVLDFGLAKHENAGVGELTASGAIFGTPHYLSPEQAGNARAVTPQSDLWSVAVIAYQCLTGERPYRGESIIELCAALAAGRFEPATSACSALPPAIDAWFERAFQHVPADRFASANELASSLAVALSTPDAAAPVAVPLDPAASRPRSSVLSTSRLGALALTAAAVGVLSFVALRETPRPSAAVARESPATLATPDTSTEKMELRIEPIASARDPVPPASVAATSDRSPAQPPRASQRVTPPRVAAPRPSATTAAPQDDLFTDPKR
jgi:serine/threonine-protein kinase